MRFQSTIFIGLLLILSRPVIGQLKLQGIYARTKKTENSTIEETLTIKADSIWFSRKKIGNNISPGEKFENWAGIVVYYKRGFDNGPFYYGSQFVMSCDTCPEFWRYTTNRKDGMSAETQV